MRERQRGWLIAAGALWIAAGVCYLLGEAIAAAGFPGYSYAHNYISDLGVPEQGQYDGRVLRSGNAWAMNAGFALHGGLFLAAAVAAAIGFPRVPRLVRVALVLAALSHAVGNALLVAVPGGPASESAGILGVHVLGAALAIIGGNTAVILAGVAAVTTHPKRRAFAVFAIALGVAGLASLVMLQLDGGSVAVDLLPDGIWERMAVYSITVWELVTGVLVLRHAPPRRS